MIGKKIIIARLEAGLTQRELAQKIDLPASTIGRWETNTYTPSPKNIAKLAEATGKTTSFFYEGEDIFFARKNTGKAMEVKDSGSWHNTSTVETKILFPLIGVIKSEEVIFLDDSNIPGINIGAPENYSLQLKDDSLSKDFEKGDTAEVIVVTEIEDGFNDKFFVITEGDDIYITKCRKFSDKVSFTIKNKRKETSLSDIKVLGRVVSRKIHL
ncbi:transcriptional regulator with XRE-family HTH domain [Elusimicrobium posterum]|uniref:helix-turn-helix domain-containing protein n=1 Tax=Elusimicrobium posterum TaxID=3116653 RepID=UPI003C7276FC